MSSQYIRNYFVVAVAGMFCWLNASVVFAQTATNQAPFKLYETPQEVLQRQQLEAQLSQPSAEGNSANERAYARGVAARENLQRAFGTPASHQAAKTKKAIDQAMRDFTPNPADSVINRRVKRLGKARDASLSVGDDNNANRIDAEIFRLELLEEERLARTSGSDTEIDSIAAQAAMSPAATLSLSDYLKAGPHKALAVGSNNKFGYAYSAPSVEEAEQAALGYCRQSGGANCQIINVDGQKVGQTSATPTPARAGGTHSSQTVDVGSGTRTCKNGITTRVVPITQSCDSKKKRWPVRQEIKTDGVGWRCWYNDGSYAESLSGCPRG